MGGTHWRTLYHHYYGSTSFPDSWVQPLTKVITLYFFYGRILRNTTLAIHLQTRARHAAFSPHCCQWPIIPSSGRAVSPFAQLPAPTSCPSLLHSRKAQELTMPGHNLH